MIAKIAVSAAAFAIDKPYSYRVPETMDLQSGVRVMVSFGRGNRRCEGIVLSVEPDDGTEGLKTVERQLDEKPVLSCSVLAVRADGRKVDTLEGLQEEASAFVGFIADQGAEQCGFCNPGFVMNTIALLRENPDPTDDEIRQYLAGNLCRCSGYEGQTRGIRAFLEARKEGRL